MSNYQLGEYEVPDFSEDNHLEFAFRGDPDEVWRYLLALEKGETWHACYSTVEVIVGEEPKDPEYLKRHPARRKLTERELVALKGMFGAGPMAFMHVYEHASDTQDLHSALSLLISKGTINLDLR